MSRVVAPNADPASAVEQTRYWQVCLPATGILVTACLYAAVNAALLSNTAVPDPLDLKVRIFEEKGDDRRDDPKRSGEKQVAGPVWREAGTVGTTTQKFQHDRRRYFDVQARQLTFLTTWSVLNLLQGAATVAALALSAGTIWMYWPRGKGKNVLAVAGTLPVVSLVLLVALDRTGVIDLTVSRSVHGELDRTIHEATQSAIPARVVTGIGNLSVGLVIVVLPFSLCVLIRSGEPARERLDRLQILMYSTTALLVLGAVQVSFQSRWPALFFDDPTNLEQIAQIALSRGLLVGATFSIASAFVFLPAGSVLRGQTLDPGGPATASQWTWLTEFFAVLAPVAAALPFGKLVGLSP